MELSTPEEIESEPVESGSSCGLDVETVEVLGDEMAVDEAVKQLGDMLERPEAFGMVPASRLTDLNERIAELQSENEQLREEVDAITESLQETYRILNTADSISQFTLTDDPSNEP